MRGALLAFAFLLLVFPSGSGTAELVGKKGNIKGEDYVNLRSGPDLNHPSKTVLRKGDVVTIAAEEGSWYLVKTPDGKKGYVHKSYVHLLASVETKELVSEKSRADLVEEKSAALPDPPLPREERESAKRKPLPVIKVLEGKEGEIFWWLAVALGIFIIGWICGGNYYLRLDRIRRKKLHF